VLASTSWVPKRKKRRKRRTWGEGKRDRKKGSNMLFSELEPQGLKVFPFFCFVLVFLK
jgi:hypothetical protein